MEGYFFKKRKSFDFKPNKFDLGRLFRQSPTHLDGFFLNKIRTINIDEYPKLYNYHLNYYIKTCQNAEEKIYFSKLYKLVTKYRTKEFKNNSSDMSIKKKARSEKIINDYDDFLKMMKSKDKWGVTFSEKDDIKNIRKIIEDGHDKMVSMKREIQSLNEELAKSRSDYKDLEKTYRTVAVPPKKKIDIKSENFGTFINLITKLKEAAKPKQSDDNAELSEKIFVTHSNSTWIKVITNNFSEEGEEIEISRVENYIVRERPLPMNSRQCKIDISSKKER
ncbi:MAG: hypothetical protein ACSHWW_13695 [Nonlabens sp.]|uniref:hypothetical protein n=1 Tax=Nonlabens sp. TaxID=1888209 RepID=UPI003EF4BCD5